MKRLAAGFALFVFVAVLWGASSVGLENLCSGPNASDYAACSD